MFKGLNVLEFTEKFSTEASCHEYLSGIKWKNGYQCGKCACTKYYNVKKVGYRLCSNCKYSESATAGTLFHKVKFPLRKAFFIIFKMVCTKKGISSHELSRQLSLRQKTCWLFQSKVLSAMKSEGQHLLEGHIEVDEFFVGGPEEGKRGRGNTVKKQVVIAIQTQGIGINRCYAKVVESGHSNELGGFFVERIQPDAHIKTDNWTGYKPLKKSYKNLVQVNSEKGVNFPQMHRQIMMFKSWLRGIHHHCIHLQRYLDEFCYRFNRIKYPQTLFHKIMEKIGRAHV